MNASWVAPGLLQASFDPAHTDYKPQRKGMPLLDKDQKTTTIYITYTAELRSDRDIYMYGIDRTYNTLEQANSRVKILGAHNLNTRSAENKLAFTDTDTGCMSVTWGRYGSQVRFMAQAKRFVMEGEVAEKDIGCTIPGGWDKAEGGLFYAEMQLDIANHVWAVAIHDPGASVMEDGLTRHRSRSHTRRQSTASIKSSGAANTGLETIEEEHRGLGWSMDSVHANSERALNRAKRAWNEHFRAATGRCRKIREHYGSARYALKPTTIGIQHAEYQTCLQIRVERVRVVPEGEMLFEFLAAQAIDKAKEPYVPFLPPLKNDSKYGRAFEGQLVTADGQRSSFVSGLQDIADRLFEGGYDYDGLPLALQGRHELALRCGGLTNQRYGEDKAVESAADLYHAILSGEDLLNPPKRTGCARGKVPTQAFVMARQRMIAAMSDVGVEEKQTEAIGDCTAKPNADASAPGTTASSATAPTPVTAKEPAVSAYSVVRARKREVTGVASCEQLLALSEKARRRTTHTAGGFMISSNEIEASTTVCDAMQKESGLVRSTTIGKLEAYTAKDVSTSEIRIEATSLARCETETAVDEVASQQFLAPLATALKRTDSPAEDSSASMEDSLTSVEEVQSVEDSMTDANAMSQAFATSTKQSHTGCVETDA
ncbi:hypothetical protein LTR08_005266 [Meristemomyces frigidus]|nr:hypothetical protein LTR08_005266 [Meristemomyces frigidus]